MKRRKASCPPVPESAQEHHERKRDGNPFGVIQEWSRYGHDDRVQQLGDHKDHLRLDRGRVENLVSAHDLELPHEGQNYAVEEVTG